MALTEKLTLLIQAHAADAIKEFDAVAKKAKGVDAEVGKAGKGTDELEGKFKKAAAGAIALGAGIGIGAAALGKLASVAGQAIDAASDLGEQMSASNVIFGKGAGIVQDFADDTARSLGISKRAAIEAANGFGDLFLNVGFTEKQSANLSVAMVQLAGDLASFKNLDTDVVLEKLRSGLVGETEPLRALGIVINEAAVKSKAMELGLGGAHRELTEGEKIAARYALIIEKTGNAQSDAARTSDSLANKQRQLAAQIEDAQAKLGSTLTPTVALFASRASNAIAAVDGLVGGGGGGGKGLAGLIDSATKANPVTAGLAWATDLLGRSQSDTGRTAELLATAERDLGLATGTLAEFTKDEGAAQKLAAKGAEEHAKALDRLLIAQIAAVDASLGVRGAQFALNDAFTTLNETVASGTATTDEIARAQLGAEQAASRFATASANLKEQQALTNGEQFTAEQRTLAYKAALIEAANQASGPAKQAILDLANSIKGLPDEKTISILVDTAQARANLADLKQKIGAVVGLSGLAAKVPGALALEGKAAGGPVKAGTAYVVGEEGPELFVSDRPGYIVPNDAVGRAHDQMVNAGANIGSGLTSGVLGLAASLQEAMRYLVTSSVMAPVEAELGIASPSDVFYGYGQATVDGYILGIKSKEDEARQAMAEFASIMAEDGSMVPPSFYSGRGGDPFAGLPDRVDYGSVSESTWQALLDAGWRGNPNDNREALYRMHSGGIVPGRPGEEVAALLQAGERVLPVGRANAGAAVIVNVYANSYAEGEEAGRGARKELLKLQARGFRGP